MRKAVAGGLLALGTFAAPAPALAEPSPAVVAMRWQWLNPEINSFTFRDTDKVFESRPVPRSAPVMNVCQIEPGSIRPNTGRPAEFLIGSLWSVPTQTAVDTDGV